MGHTRQWIIVTSASLIIVYSSVEIWQPCVWCCCCCCCCGDEKSLDPSMGLVNSPTSSHLWGIWTVKLSNRRTSHTNICRAYTQATADKNAIIPRRGANPSTRGCSPPVHPRSAATEQFKSFYCLYHAICHFFEELYSQGNLQHLHIYGRFQISPQDAYNGEKFSKSLKIWFDRIIAKFSSAVCRYSVNWQALMRFIDNLVVAYFLRHPVFQLSGKETERLLL